jgi:hypothetical protein
VKKLIIVFLCAGSLSFNSTLSAQESPVKMIKPDSHNVLTGLFKSVLVRLRAITPLHTTDAGNSFLVMTAGIGGANSDSGLLSPYWKDDLTHDEKFQAELDNFYLAQQKLDQGELKLAVQLFDDFLEAHGQSDLRPNALLAKGISLAGVGQNGRSLTAIQQFIDENPNHPMVEDAQQITAELRSTDLVTVAASTMASTLE